MNRDMPLISVLLALHDPDPAWLEQQARSIDEQDYDRLELCILDDCSEKPVSDEWFGRIMHRVPFRYMSSGVQLGTAAAFERLIGTARGDYIAYCDQDDIWEKNKLSRLMREYTRDDRDPAHDSPRVTLAYSTLSVIDADGETVARDVRRIRKHDRFFHGVGLTKQLFVVCGIYGNSMLVPADIARGAAPFAEGFSHDHWTAMWAAHCGEIRFVEEPLVRYRLHGGNQSNVYRKLRSKKDYLEYRIGNQLTRCDSALALLGDDPACPVISDIRDWTRQRERYLKGDIRALPAVVKGAHFSPRAAVFELMGAPVGLLSGLKDFG